MPEYNSTSRMYMDVFLCVKKNCIINTEQYMADHLPRRATKVMCTHCCTYESVDDSYTLGTLFYHIFLPFFGISFYVSFTMCVCIGTIDSIECIMAFQLKHKIEMVREQNHR